MPVPVLTLLKLALLLALYVFLARAVRAILLDLNGGARRSAPPRVRVADADRGGRRSRRVPRELVLHSPDGDARVIALEGRGLVLGRAGGATLVLDDVYVSDEHAEVLPDGDGWAVRDLGSTNGTFVNDAKVTRQTPIAVGDRLQVGKTRIEVRR
ncbi:MAG: hypothetical protein RLZZ272_986 [Actinomycetota bacterium]